MSNGPITHMFDKSHRREDQALTLFDKIKAGEVQADKLVYRGHRCRHVLAEVYKLSGPVNQQESVAAGRENNTLDGDNTWKKQVYFIEQGYPNLQCSHIHDYRLDPERIKQDVVDGKTEVTI